MTKEVELEDLDDNAPALAILAAQKKMLEHKSVPRFLNTLNKIHLFLLSPKGKGKKCSPKKIQDSLNLISTFISQSAILNPDTPVPKVGLKKAVLDYEKDYSPKKTTSWFILKVALSAAAIIFSMIVGAILFGLIAFLMIGGPFNPAAFAAACIGAAVGAKLFFTSSVLSAGLILGGMSTVMLFYEAILRKFKPDPFEQLIDASFDLLKDPSPKVAV